MTIKATTIGGAPSEEERKVSPTRLGGSGAGDALPPSPTQPVPAPQSIARPTTFRPTSMPGAAPATPSVVPSTLPTTPTVLPPTAATAPVRSEPVRASVLPGTQRKPLDVSVDDLALRFPGTERELLERARGLLAGVTPQTMSTPAWLSFGVPAQESLSHLVKERVSLMETSIAPSVSQHLARMQYLLREVLDAMDGGFFKKPAATVWASIVGEVRQLETLLSNAGPALGALLGAMGELVVKNKSVCETLHANSLAAEYLIDVVSPEAGHLLVSRATSLTASQTLALEQIQALSLDAIQVQELSTLVQDGVLLQLPAVHSQLAGLSTKPSDTQRYLATEKLNEIVNLMQRKL